MGRAIFNIVDFDGDRQQVSVETINAALDGSDFGALWMDVTDLQTSIAAIILGNNGPVTFQAYESGSTPPPPSDVFAQVNIQWIFEFTDDVSGQRRTMRLGTADLDVATILYNGAPAIDLSTGVGAALKANFEAVVVNDGNAVTLNAVYFRE